MVLRLLLPPNLAAAAARNAVVARLELDEVEKATAQVLPALALLSAWTGAAPSNGRLRAVLQLDRAKLRQLVAALEGQPVFFAANDLKHPIPWDGLRLVGVSEHLAEPEEAPAGGIPAGSGEIQSERPPRRGGPAEVSGAPLLVDGSEHFLSFTLPSREHPTYKAALDLARGNGFVPEPSNGRWWLRDRHKTLSFLARHGERLRAELGARFTANFQKQTAKIRPVEVVREAAAAGDGFEVVLGLRAGQAPEAAVRSALASGRSYVETPDGIVLIDPELIRKLDEAQRALGGSQGASGSMSRTRIGAARAAEAEEILGGLAPGFKPPEQWRRRTEALRNLSKLQPAPVPAGLDAQLRVYQRLGAAWLWHLHGQGLGGILADEMGLGKTLQALAVLAAARMQRSTGGTPVGEFGHGQRSAERDEARRAEGVAERSGAAPSQSEGRAARRADGDTGGVVPEGTNAHVPLPGGCCSLVVCPASLLENWRREAARFAPELRAFVHHGENRVETTAGFGSWDLVITSYGTLARDRELFAGAQFACVVGDEAQHVKNARSQNAQALRTLRAGSRFLLTGTPVENSLEDLRSLLDFLLPGYVDRVPAGARSDERAWFDARLRAKAAPYILRRTKGAVAPELPAKIEQVVWCELSAPQAALYREVQERTERQLIDLAAAGASEAGLRRAALTQLLRLRQVCCDPRLVMGGEGTGGTPVLLSGQAGAQTPVILSAKLEAWKELLAEAVDDGHRVLVFSQFTSLLALLREELDGQGTAYCYLDGSMPAAARQAEVDRFQTEGDVPVFLLSLKAGGAGLNLTGADTVIHYDPWWNPAVEAQATDRAHRIGQNRVVTSYKLVCSGTVEEKVLGLQAEKRTLLADIFEASDAAAARLSLADLKELLR